MTSGFMTVIKTIIIGKITKDNEEIEKIEKYSKKTVRIVYNSLYVCARTRFCVCVCVHAFVWVIFVYYCICIYK